MNKKFIFLALVVALFVCFGANSAQADRHARAIIITVDPPITNPPVISR